MRIYFTFIVAFLFFISGCTHHVPKHASNRSTHAKKPEKPAWVLPKYAYHPSKTLFFDLIHTSLEVKPVWEKKQLESEATITLKPHFNPQFLLELDAVGFEIKELTVEIRKNIAKPTYTYQGTKLSINLGQKVTKNDTIKVYVKYIAKPDEVPTSGSQAITSDKGLYFINADLKDPKKPRQLWSQGETESSSKWFPTIDSPNQKMTQEVRITVENIYKTLSNGEFVYATNNGDGTRTDYWKQDFPHAPYLCMIAVGEYAKIEDTWRNKPVDYYVEPAYARYAQEIFGNTPEMIELFSTKLGVDFAWDKYSQVIVRDFVSGAMENTTASVFMEAVQSTHRELLDRNWDDIISHELFHQWFGDLVTCESWSNIPLNESFATYGEYLWFEEKYGKDEADHHLHLDLIQYLNESKVKQAQLIRYRYNDKEDLFDSHSYAKGGCLLHALRNYLGDDAFFAGLKNYLTKNKFKSVEVHNLRLALEETSGQDLNWFFDQYFLSSGHLKLAVEEKYVDGKLKITAVQLQDSVYTPIYKLPFAINVWVKGEKIRHDVEMNSAVQVFEFDIQAQPDLVVVDADHVLVAEIIHDKTDESLIYQYGHESAYRSRFDALNKISNRLEKSGNRKMMFEALRDPFWYLREMAIDNFKNYNGVGFDTAKAYIREMAWNDPKPQTRAAAIDFLSALKSGDFTSIYLTGLNDSAYSVVGASLSAYLKLNKDDNNKLLTKYEQEDNLEIVSALAAYYSEHNDSTKFDWFKQKINATQGKEMYYLITYFNTYAQKLSVNKQLAAVKVMEPIARTNSSFWAKLAAYKCISQFKSLPGVEILRADIMEKETNPALKAKYKQIP